VVAPEEVIERYGAEILRLWVAAEDYRDDIRISEEILARLSEAYRRICNTCRFLLGNLSDFDPSRHSVSQDQLLDLDRWILSRLQKLIARLREAYETYEFHMVFHSLHNFCTVDLSSLYLDILKDRLYTSPARSRHRRAAQTALHKILDTLVRLMAPILSFTAEEVWQLLPGALLLSPSIHLAPFPQAEDKFIDEKVEERFDLLLKIRSEVSRALEEARKKKLLGNSLEASVALNAPPQTLTFLRDHQEILQDLFIVSQVELVESAPRGASPSQDLEGLHILISRAPGQKCERCWMYNPKVGGDSQHPSICPRCRDAIATVGQEETR